MFASGAGFTFQAGARAIDQRPKYRNEQNAPPGPCLITVDPRVYRGSTYSKHRPAQPEIQPVRPRARVPTPARYDQVGPPASRDGQINIQTQTEPYLQEILEKAAEVEEFTQTDNFLDRPPTPPFFRRPIGIDEETQVDEPELFDWEFEVQPIVSTIVGKTIEQAFMEVHEEEELANVRRHKEAIEHRRNVELADVQRLEEGERRKFEEKERRLEQRIQFETAQHELRAKIAAKGYGEFFSVDLMSDAISLLERRGYFYDEVEREIETVFIPWLGRAMEEAKENRALIEAIVSKVEEKTVMYDEQLKEEAVSQTEDAQIEGREHRLAILRQMYVEDRGAVTIRKALQGRKKKPKARTEEEDQTDSG
jgi:hypothetical protein